jgi:broad specificity phosphatase PhoE
MVMLGFAICAAAALLSPDSIASEPATRPVTYIVRHMHKAPGDDPPLSPEGRRQAESLAAELADKQIVAIFATKTRRAMETAAPLARRLAIAVTLYEPGDAAALVKAALAPPGPVLVVGHSNTVADLVARFGGPEPEPLTEQDYGTLFIVEADGEVTRVELR